MRHFWPMRGQILMNLPMYQTASIESEVFGSLRAVC